MPVLFPEHGHADCVGGCLITSDCVVVDEGLSFHGLLSIASQSRGRNKVIILDCCRSGGVGNIGLFKDFSIIGEGIVILAACRGSRRP
ncbi:MAG: hypothetical protein MJY64_03140 [archaeon]|nr:hypothetical protein [archaeon]